MPDKTKHGSGGDTLEFTTKLLDALASSRNGIQGIIDIGYEALNNPIMVSGKSWKVIAMTNRDAIPEDNDWNDFATTGVLSPDSIYMNVKSRLADRIEHSETPFCWHGQKMKYRRIFSRVLVGGHFSATVSVVEHNREFTEQDHTTVSLLCWAISAELQKNPDTRYARSLFQEEFIEDLLEGSVKSDVAIAERERSLNLGLKKYIHVIVLNINEFDDAHYSISYVCETLERMIAGSRAIVHNEVITLLATYARTDGQPEADISLLDEFARKFRIHCGVSRCVVGLSAVCEAYGQSLEALRLGTYMDAEGFIYRYDDYAIYHVARLCSEHTDLKTLCHPKLEELIEYDAKHNTFFTDSLYVYLRCGRSSPTAANALHLHRNTMNYHLHRIEEVLGIDFGDSALMFSFELSFRFLEYGKRFDTKRFSGMALGK